MDGVGHGLSRDAAHLDQVLVKFLGQRHWQAGEQGLAVHVGIRVQLKPAPAPDGVGRLVRGDGLVGGGEQRQLVIEADQVAARIEGIGGCRPVLKLLVDVGHDVGHLRPGVLRCAYVVGGDHRFGDIGVEYVHAQGQQERGAVLQRRLHQVTD